LILSSSAVCYVPISFPLILELSVLDKRAICRLSGVAIGGLALGNADSVSVLLYSSETFNANVVSTGLVLGYVAQGLPRPNKE
jgi:ApbE superfamily uncharacterized protein (UPF0280 family)